ncbi:MAG: hydrogenase accessory protein HypB [Planctomycetes bacterium RBG_16_64_12]|nr:MAG: hydrogenase accessory protein HypB [Planctomycetes bacterium RBG_16_64_12]
MKIIAAKKILKANDQLAEENRTALNAGGVFCVNMVGSPGCGKTTLLEALFARLKGRLAPAVIEGDIAGSIDAERIDAIGVPVVQINTDGACHLDANMIAAAARDLDYRRIDLLVIENVGNLVCTAGFDLGEHLRVVVLSVPEGDDKLAKYPAIFQGSQALVISKMDLLAHIRFDVDRVIADMKRLAPAAEIFQVAALTGEGIPAMADWLTARCSRPVGYPNCP